VPRLRLLDVDTGASRPLAARRFAHNASWAPDGRRLVVEDYGTRGGSGPQFAVTDLRSGDAHVITRSSALDESPAWSPNGRRIVF
jgi:TolB protein